jgi:hypothetical protein
MQLLRSPLPAYLHGSLRSDSSEEKNHAGASLLDERLNRFFSRVLETSLLLPLN